MPSNVQYLVDVYSALIGFEIVEVKVMKYDESFPALVVRHPYSLQEFFVIPSRDSEMNGPGRLMIVEKINDNS